MARAAVKTREIETPTDAFWPHQQESVGFFTNRQCGFDNSSPGTGKTAVQVRLYAQRAKPRGRWLVVCPKTLMVSAWGEDIERFAPGLTVSFAYAEQRKEAFEMATDVVVINIDGVKWLASKEGTKYLKQFDHLTIDEYTGFKHATSQRAKAMVKIRNNFKYRYGMSGTPNPNTVMELYNPALIIDNGARLGTSYYRLRNVMQMPEQIGPSPDHLKWTDKPGAAQAVNELLGDITIRHVFQEVMTHVPANHKDVKRFDLSPKMRKIYDKMALECLVAFDEGVVNAVHAASLRTKLLQIACLSGNTPVLCESGWRSLSTITNERVWDGKEWVQHDGLALKGIEQVIECFGVWMTPEHLVLTTQGWQRGESCERFDRQPVRFPDGYRTGRNDIREHNAESNVAMSVRLRDESGTRKPISADETSLSSTTLRMPARQQNTRDDQYPRFLQMGRYVESLLKPNLQKLRKLWRAWNNSVRTLAQVVSSILGRHGIELQAGAFIGAYQQQPRLQPGQLPLGNCKAASQQYAQQYLDRHPEGANDNKASRRSLRDKTSNPARTTTPLQLDGEVRFEPVYDLVNCGPHHRFVVKSKDGQALIVHNSGAVYDGGEGSSYKLVDTTRYELVVDLIEEREHSVVFFNWKHQRDYISAELTKRGMTFALLDGSVPQRQRDAIVSDYQAGKYKTILLHPRTGAHGLTLTRGDTTIFCSPIYEADLMEQGLARIYRGTQDKVTNTIFIEAKNTVEQLVYARLNTKHAGMQDLLDQQAANSKK